jgi:hypothetical protein
MDPSVIELILRIGQGAVAVGVALYNALRMGDVSAVEELTKHCDPADQILARSAALVEAKRREADEKWGADTLPPGTHDGTFEGMALAHGVPPELVPVLRRLATG